MPHLLLALVSTILEGPSIKNQMQPNSTQAALSISQILKYNCVKHIRKEADSNSFVRHRLAQETPVPTYVGLLLHAQTRKRELVDRLYSLGLSISYDRVLRISAELGNNLCQRYHNDQVVCPPSLKGNVFTTSAVDNIDHNPSSTTAKDSFHGTGISLFQHPSCSDDGIDRGTVFTRSSASSTKTVNCLPHFYTNVQSISASVKHSPVSATSIISLQRNGYKKHNEEEYRWLESSRKILEGNTNIDNISWAAYHAKNQESQDRFVTTSALLYLSFMRVLTQLQ